MVSRFGVNKDVGVVVGMGPMQSMHCLMPHCASGPHHLSPQAQNPGGVMAPAPAPPATHSHAHVHTHNHHPQPAPSPHGHLNHLNLAAPPHQITINIAHHQQLQGQQAPPQPQQQYRIVPASATRNEAFHIAGQNYGAQPGSQVGGGGSSVGVAGGRGPPQLSGIQPLGQTTTGIPTGGPGAAAQQAPPQPQTPGVQPLQSQVANQTTTPPVGVHTSTAPDMGKQTHIPNQPNAMPPVTYGQGQNRPVSFYPAGPRPQQQRITHRNQGNAGAAMVNMPVGNGQQAGMYPHPHPQNLTAIPPMNVQIQLGLHPQQHQFANPIQMQNMNAVPPNIRNYQPQRHQQGQMYYHQFYVSQPPQHQHQQFAFYPTHNTSINMSRTNASSVSGGAQHSGSPLVGAQSTSIAPQGPLQQPPQPQPMPVPMVPQVGADIYMTHNGAMANMPNNMPRNQSVKKESKALPIIDPTTGKNVLSEGTEAKKTSQTDNSSRNSSSQLQNGAEVRAMFAEQVAKTLEEPSSKESKSEVKKELPAKTPEKAEEKKAVEVSQAQPEKPKDEEKELTKVAPAAQSPPRRKSQSQAQSAPASKEQERKKDEKPNSEATVPREHAANKPTNGEADKETENIYAKNENAAKTADGKSTQQKQKNKGKVRRELNRRGAEKEGTEMDAFVNSVAPAKIEPEVKAQPKESAPAQVDVQATKEQPAPANVAVASAACTILVKDLEKSVKDLNLNEAKKVKLEEATRIDQAELEKTPQIEKDIVEQKVAQSQDESHVEKADKDKPDDVVDHAVVQEVTSADDLKAIVDKKNEENVKMSEQTAASESAAGEPEIEAPEQIEPDVKREEAKAQAPIKPVLRYKYTEDMWSPINQAGRKVYTRDFLMCLQEDPHSQRKPGCLPDLEVVLKDHSNKNQAPMSMRMSNNMAHRSDSFFPFAPTPNDRHKASMAKSNMAASKNPGMMRDQNKRNKPVKPMQVSISLREDVKLKESSNAWKPSRMKNTSVTEEEEKTERLYKKVRSVLNKLTPENLETLVKQVQGLEIDSRERLDGVIKLVFEKAIEEPNFSETYALFCKEVGNMQVMSSDSMESNAASFKKLLITRCQVMFENHASEENVTTQELHKAIEECKDPEKKKELQITLDEEKRRIRMKSVGNIRFIGEIFKLGMLTVKIMIMCINHLLDHPNEENLECLCKLLTTIGENLENKNENLNEFFEKMHKFSLQKTGKNKISSRIRFMLQDVIDLRKRKWVPRRDLNAPKTMGEIKQDFINEKKIQQGSAFTPPVNTPRKDDRGDRKRNRPGQAEDGWIQPSGRTSRQPLTVETSKLKNKPPSMDDLQLGNRNMYTSMYNKNIQSSGTKMMTSTNNKFQLLDNYSEQDKRMQTPMHFSGSRSTGPQYRSDYGKSNYDRSNTRNGNHQMNSSSSSRDSHAAYESARSQSMSMPPPSMKLSSQSTPAPKPELSNDEIIKLIEDVFKKYTSSNDVEQAKGMISEKISGSNAVKFVSEVINFILEKREEIRRSISQLLCTLISSNCISLRHFISGLMDNLKMIEDLIIDIPMAPKYFAEIVGQPIAKGLLPLSELTTITQPLKSIGSVGRFLSTLLSELKKEKSLEWIQEKYSQSGLKLEDLVDPKRENIDDIIFEYFLTDAKGVSSKSLDFTYIHESLFNMMRDNVEFDKITSWITEHVGDNVKYPKFVRTLMTAILESSIQINENKYEFLIEKFAKQEKLIQRYVDTNPQFELQCLFAVQAIISKLKYPQGLTLKIFNRLLDNNVISIEGFLAWEQDNNPAEQEGKGFLVKSTTSFFTSLKETEEDEASDDDAPVKSGLENALSDEDMPSSIDKESSAVAAANPPAHPSSSSLSQNCRG